VQKAHIQRTITIEQSSWKFHSPMFLGSAWNLKEVKLSIKTICSNVSFLKNFLDLYTKPPHSLWWLLLLSSKLYDWKKHNNNNLYRCSIKWTLTPKEKQTNKQTLIISKCDWWERERESTIRGASRVLPLHFSCLDSSLYPHGKGKREEIQLPK
jgi:hypothetical protein